jgi:hypothetical protein
VFVIGAACRTVRAADTVASPTRSGVVLLLAFSWEGDSAAALIERGVRFGVAHSDSTLGFDVVKCGSAYEVRAACDTLMQQESRRLIVFAGDEGAAAVVAILSSQHRMPVLKLTGDSRSMTPLSNQFFEFLPSGETQGRTLGDFAARFLGLSGAMVYTPLDARGRALADGFKSGFVKAGGALEVQQWYPPDAMAIRPGIDAMFADTARKALGGTRLNSALSPEERAQMFGSSQGGEVLYAGQADTLHGDSVRAREGFFFALTPEHVEGFAKQLPTLAPKTVLLGNSSWVDLDVLERRETVTNGMYIVLPLMPEALDTSGFLVSYQQTGAVVNEWSLLGLDAGRFLGQVISGAPRTRMDIARALTEAPRMTGISVIVDFQKGHENTAARVVRYEDGGLRVVK